MPTIWTTYFMLTCRQSIERKSYLCIPSFIIYYIYYIKSLFDTVNCLRLHININIYHANFIIGELITLTNTRKVVLHSIKLLFQLKYALYDMAFEVHPSKLWFLLSYFESGCSTISTTLLIAMICYLAVLFK